MSIGTLSPEDQRKVLEIVGAINKLLNEKFGDYPVWASAQAMTLLAVENYVAVEAQREDFDNLVTEYWAAFTQHFAHALPTTGTVH